MGAGASLLPSLAVTACLCARPSADSSCDSLCSCCGTFQLQSEYYPWGKRIPAMTCVAETVVDADGASGEVPGLLRDVFSGVSHGPLPFAWCSWKRVAVERVLARGVRGRPFKGLLREPQDAVRASGGCGRHRGRGPGGRAPPGPAPLGSCLRRNDEVGGGVASTVGRGVPLPTQGQALDTGIRRYEGVVDPSTGPFVTLRTRSG